MTKRSEWSIGCLLLIACMIAAVVLVAWNLVSVTEFSPDTLKFRAAIYFGDVRILPMDEWSTPLLDDARDKHLLAAVDGPSRWSYVHGNNLVGRPCFTNGDAKVAYRLFRSGVWNDVLSDPKNNKDEIVKEAVKLMRDFKYSEAADLLYEKRFGK